MNQGSPERRQYPRIYFVPEDDTAADVRPPAPVVDPPAPARLLSLSEGGLSFLAGIGTFPRLREGDQLTLDRIDRPAELTFLRAVDLEVCHVHTGDRNLVCGCQFVNIPPGSRTDLRDYIRERLDVIRRHSDPSRG